MATMPYEIAFPVQFTYIGGEIELHQGMTKREWFTGMALQGLLASLPEHCTQTTMDAIGTDAVGLADDAIRALNAEEDNAEPTDDPN